LLKHSLLLKNKIICTFPVNLVSEHTVSTEWYPDGKIHCAQYYLVQILTR